MRVRSSETSFRGYLVPSERRLRRAGGKFKGRLAMPALFALPPLRGRVRVGAVAGEEKAGACGLMPAEPDDSARLTPHPTLPRKGGGRRARGRGRIGGPPLTPAEAAAPSAPAERPARWD